MNRNRLKRVIRNFFSSNQDYAGIKKFKIILLLLIYADENHCTKGLSLRKLTILSRCNGSFYVIELLKELEAIGLIKTIKEEPTNTFDVSGLLGFKKIGD